MPPDSASLTSYKRMNAGDFYESGQTTTLSNGKFDIRASARWHKLLMTFNGNMVISGINIDMQAEGDR